MCGDGRDYRLQRRPHPREVVTAESHSDAATPVSLGPPSSLQYRHKTGTSSYPHGDSYDAVRSPGTDAKSDSKRAEFLLVAAYISHPQTDRKKRRFIEITQ